MAKGYIVSLYHEIRDPEKLKAYKEIAEPAALARGGCGMPVLYVSDHLRAAARGCEIDFFQSNAEYALVERIHAAADMADVVVINPAALTHTSVAIRDAFLGVGLPFIEVHLSNVHAREPFRHHSYLSDVALGVVAGFGAHSYYLALDGALAYINRENG